GYHPSIRSRVGATGLWQLMAPTARELGLSVDGLVDDRRDPVVATRAAMDYLAQLHLRFDSWYLALSAYNAGPARVGRALARHAPDPDMAGDERYLRIRPHLPAETREFIPRLFAAAALASEPERYGFSPPDPSRALAYDQVVVPDATSMDVVAEAAGVDEDDVLRLNPHLIRGFTPPGEERVVRIPAGRADIFQENYEQIPPDERLSFLEHVVARGETLGHIARRYQVSLAELQGANGGADPRRLQIGQRLVVPVGSGAGTAAVGNGAASRPARHIVSAGESLWTIARHYGISVQELARMNGRAPEGVLRIGEELAIP
ncbi:MAG: LysM peptidoglycan-binding domain-containing protein, partial [Acidobacteriota bacterium]